MLGNAEKYILQDQERWLVKRFLCVCAFVDPPEEGIRKIREILARQRLPGYELRDVVAALGHSHSEEALEILRELSADDRQVEQLGEAWANAVAAIGGPRARNLLLSFVDPSLESVPGEQGLCRENVLAARIADLGRDDRAVHARLLELCSADLPPLKRQVLARVIGSLESSEAVVAGLNLIDDAGQPPVPRELWEQIEASFVERVPSVHAGNVYRLEAKPANRLRLKLHEMAAKDQRRKRSAFALLGQIEEWRLEHGRPTGEPRNPVFESGERWPPVEP
jgi:hypothetical protein